jgi:hypothetical protein
MICVRCSYKRHVNTAALKEHIGTGAPAVLQPWLPVYCFFRYLFCIYVNFYIHAVTTFFCTLKRLFLDPLPFTMGLFLCLGALCSQ